MLGRSHLFLLEAGDRRGWMTSTNNARRDRQSNSTSRTQCPETILEGAKETLTPPGEPFRRVSRGLFDENQ